MNIIELFAGIGATAKALKKIYGNSLNVVDIVENDKKAVESYNLIHNTNFVAKDVLNYDYNGDVEIDLIHASTPCQAFSVAGKGLGSSDERGLPLWDATLRIIKKVKPKFVTLENVKGLLQKKHQNVLNYYLEEMNKMGYKTFYKCINAKNFNCAQERERVFFCSKLNDENWNFEIPEKAEFNKNIIIRDIMEENVKWIETKEFFLGSDENTFLIKNELSNYNGKTIEIYGEKLFNQIPTKINRVAKLKKVDYESNKNFFGSNGLAAKVAAKSYCKFQNKLLDVAFHNRSSFCGLEGKHWCQTACDVNLSKILKLETIPFNEDSDFFGCNGCSRTLTTKEPRFKSKLLDLKDEVIFKYRPLTTLEVFRLMTFDDEDYFKTVNKISDHQLCKQLGNSVVVNCLYEIYKNML